MQKKKTRQQKLSQLKDSVQALANKYARLRDCGVDGGAVCISCDKWFPFDKLDGGHFIATTSSAIRFDEENINAQCHRCNRFLHGNPRHYLRGMSRKYGDATVARLEAMEFVSKEWSREELEQLRGYYRGKINELKRPAPAESATGLDMQNLYARLATAGGLPKPRDAETPVQ